MWTGARDCSPFPPALAYRLRCVFRAPCTSRASSRSLPRVLSGCLGWIYFAGIALVALLLALEHRIVNPRDLSRIDIAFFTVNSWVGMAVLASTALDLWMRR